MPTSGPDRYTREGPESPLLDIPIEGVKKLGYPPSRAYVTDGFQIVSQPRLPRDVVEGATEGMEAVRAGVYDTGAPPQPSYWNPGDDPNKLCKIEMPQVANRALMALVSHPALGRAAAEVTGAQWMQVWWVQLLLKPPTCPGSGTSTNIGWHQDRYYWQCWEEASELLTAWVALSDVTEETGPMRFLRGSHRWGFLNQGDFWGQDLTAQSKEIRPPTGETWEDVAAILPPGGVSFHHCLTFHGSGPNRSAGPRRSLALHLRTEKSRPVNDLRSGLTAFIDDPSYCPVIYRA